MATKFTDAEITILKRILYGTWEYIGNDIMESLNSEGRDSIPRADVAEVVLDADHCKKMVFELKAQILWAKFDAMLYKDRIKFTVKYAFPCARYS